MSKNKRNNHNPNKKCFLGKTCARIYAAFCSVIFLVWYLCRLKPQDISFHMKIIVLFCTKNKNITQISQKIGATGICLFAILILSYDVKG